jgi:hypothetical protein
MESSASENLNLLHPFYLDTDMSMAFAAALTGGVALQREEVEQGKQESEAVRNLRGNLRLFDFLGLGGARESKEGDSASTESRLRREHTKASIFIGLYDELQRAGRVQHAGDLASMRAGELVSLDIGPAVAPLRRIVDQVLRLLDVAVPLAGVGDPDESEDAAKTRQQRRQKAREAAKAAQANEDAGLASIQLLRQVFIALQDDLERSGMVDIVVQRDEAPSVVLTLDERFVTDQVLELLHTSKFTVIGKVTQLWPKEDDFVNLYRRSVLSLAPALVQTMSLTMLEFLVAIAKGFDATQALESFQATMGGDGVEDSSEPASEANDTEDSSAQPADQEGVDLSDVMLSEEAFKAVLPGVSGPAFQILPLAICA